MISGTMPFIAAVVLASITIATCTNVHPMAASAESRSNTVSDTQGCCCCSGACLYANYPPCPCPQPAPGHPLPKCQLQETIELFLNKYATLAPKNSNSKDFYPAKTVAVDGKKELTWQSSAGWTSGFYPGLLWHLANFTSKSNPAMAKMFHDAADTCTLGRAVEANDTGTHDVGFMVFGSFGQGYEFGRMGKPYAEVIVQAAHSLATRYNPIVGMTRSWGASDDNSKFEVIIDNLMNLELLFWAAEYTGNSTLSDIAVSHAKKTGEFWFREDNSTAHLCVFSPQTGKLLYPCTGTPQGYSNASTWARGQAWGIYGWTMAHRYTQDPVFVTYAEKATSYFLAVSTSNPALMTVCNGLVEIFVLLINHYKRLTLDICGA